ncbi:DUF4149 domain-containing protein [Halorussus lipolyticus]|uniref:DUF4149 domain-containing protein n=1 Tax=Halorussus lipolyticus TaxID=3034024 RepID=UPI0023E8AC76|nr:DUF4149 domain-containing protein [Halorussus sp. DT80]
MSLLQTALTTATDAALGIWLGTILFFSFVGAPTTFDVLGDDAGQVVNAIFPKYYLLGVGLGAAALVAVLVAGLVTAFDAPRIGLLALVGGGIGMNAYARWVLIPKMDRAGDDAFAQYHKQSVALNGVTMLAVGTALVLSHV